MRQVVVLSGKGGTGKTCVTAALGHLASRDRRIVLVDADVDASNLGLLASPTVTVRHDFSGGQVAAIDRERCEDCGDCLDACRFTAVRENDGFEIDEGACEGCAACMYRCPPEAITMHPVLTGEWFESETRFGPLYHARLVPGRENSGKLVSAVRQAAVKRAEEEEADLVLVDGPPGIGCPVIAASTGCHLALLVAEPTVSGAHDLDRALGTVRHFGIPAIVCVNKADLSPAWTERLLVYCAEKGVEVAARIPFDRAVPRAMLGKQAVTEAGPGPAADAVEELSEQLRKALLALP